MRGGLFALGAGHSYVDNVDACSASAAAAALPERYSSALAAVRRG
jgi:hypothetical protein